MEAHRFERLPLQAKVADLEARREWLLGKARALGLDADEMDPERSRRFGREGRAASEGEGGSAGEGNES